MCIILSCILTPRKHTLAKMNIQPICSDVLHLAEATVDIIQKYKFEISADSNILLLLLSL